MNRSASLYALQQVDSEIDARKHRLAEVISLMGETEELLNAHRRMETAQESLSQWRAWQRDQELAVQSVERKKQASERRLYGGKVRNPKELSDLQGEVDSLNRRKITLEDKLLEMMLEVEEGEAEEQEAAADLLRIEALWKSSQANLGAEKEIQESRLVALTVLREGQIASIPPADLKSYEYTRQRKGGQAIARLQGNECQGCMTTIPSNKVKEARSNTLVFCGTCGRIMHLG